MVILGALFGEGTGSGVHSAATDPHNEMQCSSRCGAGAAQRAAVFCFPVFTIHSLDKRFINAGYLHILRSE